MMPPMILVTRLTVTAMMNDGGDADDDAVHQNVGNRCGSNKMRDDDDVDIDYCVLLAADVVDDDESISFQNE